MGTVWRIAKDDDIIFASIVQEFGCVVRAMTIEDEDTCSSCCFGFGLGIKDL